MLPPASVSSLATLCTTLYTTSYCSSDETNQCLLTRLNSSGQIHMVPASLSDRFVIRFCVCHENATEKDVVIAYEIIKQTANAILRGDSFIPSVLPVLLGVFVLR